MMNTVLPFVEADGVVLPCCDHVSGFNVEPRFLRYSAAQDPSD